jgi:hypothetical protein
MLALVIGFFVLVLLFIAAKIRSQASRAGVNATWTAVRPSACGVPARAIKLGALVTIGRRSFVCAHQSLPAKVKRSPVGFLSLPASR